MTAVPAIGEDGVISEGRPFPTQCLPSEVGLRHQEVDYTCIDASQQFLAVGSAQGYVWVIELHSSRVLREFSEFKGSVITALKLNPVRDYVVYGTSHGFIRVERLTKVKSNRLRVLEKSGQGISCLEWSRNGQDVFCGFNSGRLVQFNVQFSEGIMKQMPLSPEQYESSIVQLSATDSQLLVSTLNRAFILDVNTYKVDQVGRKERKSGRYGGTFLIDGQMTLSRPGLRLWIADKLGKVLGTMGFKDALSTHYLPALVINSISTAPLHFNRLWQFSTLHPWLGGKYVVTFYDSTIFVLDPINGLLVGAATLLASIKSVSISGGFLYILSASKSIVRVAMHHSYVTKTYDWGKKLKFTAYTSVSNSPMGSLERLLDLEKASTILSSENKQVDEDKLMSTDGPICVDRSEPQGVDVDKSGQLKPEVPVGVNADKSDGDNMERVKLKSELVVHVEDVDKLDSHLEPNDLYVPTSQEVMVMEVQYSPQTKEDRLDPSNGLDNANQGLDLINQGLDPTNQGLDLTNQGLELTNQGLDPTNQGLDLTNQLDPANQGLDLTNQGLEPTNQGLDLTNQRLDPTNQGLANQLEPTNQGLDLTNQGLEPTNQGLDLTYQRLDLANQGLDLTNQGLEPANHDSLSTTGKGNADPKLKFDTKDFIKPKLAKLSDILPIPWTISSSTAINSDEQHHNSETIKDEPVQDTSKNTLKVDVKEHSRRLRMSQAAGDEIVADSKSHRRRKKKVKGKKISSDTSSLSVSMENFGEYLSLSPSPCRDLQSDTETHSDIIPHHQVKGTAGEDNEDAGVVRGSDGDVVEGSAIEDVGVVEGSANEDVSVVEGSANEDVSVVQGGAKEDVDVVQGNEDVGVVQGNEDVGVVQGHVRQVVENESGQEFSNDIFETQLFPSSVLDNSGIVQLFGTDHQPPNGVVDLVGLPSVDGVADPVRLPSVDRVADHVGLPSVDGAADPVGLPSVDRVADPVGLPSVDRVADPVRLPSVDGAADPVGLPSVDGAADPVGIPSVDGVADPVGLLSVDGVADSETLGFAEVTNSVHEDMSDNPLYQDTDEEHVAINKIYSPAVSEAKDQEVENAVFHRYHSIMQPAFSDPLQQDREEELETGTTFVPRSVKPFPPSAKNTHRSVSSWIEVKKEDSSYLKDQNFVMSDSSHESETDVGTEVNMFESQVVDDFYELCGGLVEGTPDRDAVSHSHYPQAPAAALVTAPPPPLCEAQETEGTSNEKSMDEDNWDIWVSIPYPTRHSLQCVCLSDVLLWIVDSRGRVFCTNTATSRGRDWQQIKKPMQHVASSSSGRVVWGTYHQNAYVRSGIGMSLSGNLWKNITRSTSLAHKIKTLSVEENAVWAITVDNRILFRKGVDEKNPEGKVWQEVSYGTNFSFISCCKDTVWALNATGNVFVRDSISPASPSGKKWIDLKTPKMTVVSLTTDGVVWGINEQGSLGFRTGVNLTKPGGRGPWWEVVLNTSDTPATPHQSMWHVMSMDGSRRLTSAVSSLVTLPHQHQNTTLSASSKAGVVVLENGSTLNGCWRMTTGYHYTPACKAGAFQSNMWSRVAAGGTGLWFVRNDGDLYCLSPGDMLKKIEVPSSVELIAASPNCMWVISKDMVWSRQGMSAECPDGISFDYIELSTLLHDKKLRSVACGKKVAWGIDSSGVPHFRFGVHAREPGTGMSPAWVPVEDQPGPLFQIAVSPDDWLVWACDENYNVYARHGVTVDFPVGRKWVSIPSQAMRELAATSDRIYGLTPSGELMCRYGISKNNVQGSFWRRMPGKYEHITTGEFGELWTLDDKGQVWKQEWKVIRVCTEEFDRTINDPETWEFL